MDWNNEHLLGCVQKWLDSAKYFKMFVCNFSANYRMFVYLPALNEMKCKCKVCNGLIHFPLLLMRLIDSDFKQFIIQTGSWNRRSMKYECTYPYIFFVIIFPYYFLLHITSSPSWGIWCNVRHSMLILGAAYMLLSNASIGCWNQFWNVVLCLFKTPHI